MGRFDALTEIEREDRKRDGLLANQQASKEEKKQTSLPVNQQARKEENEQTSKLANQQARPLVPSTKQKKKYGTYLLPESITKLKVHGAQTDRKDHEVLQEAVDMYFERLNS